MSSLIEKHLKDIRFALLLRHRVTGLYVAKNGMSERRQTALFVETDSNGKNIAELLDILNESQDHPWLGQLGPSEFEIESELA